MICRLAVTAAGGEAAYAADGVAEGESGGEAVESGERGHVIFAQEPDGDGESGEQASGENAAGLQECRA